MLVTYDLQGEAVNSLDLKCLLSGTGMRYPNQVYEAVAGRSRLAPPSNPYACNCIILPGEVAVHLTANDASPFGLDLDDQGRVCLFHQQSRLTEVSFPLATDYYSQRTLQGRPFGAIAVLEGSGLIAFFYMWPCDYIRTHETCEFCFQVRADMAGFDLPSPTDEEVAEIIAWGIEHAGVREVQLTAGTRFNTRDECQRYARLLGVVDRAIGLDRIPSEIYCYVTAPTDPASSDQILEAGADRIAHDLHVWDRDLQARIAPGHARHVGRDAQLRALEHVADKFGPNRAMSAFVAGIEPLDSMLEGAEYLASRGIVPTFSVWMPPAGTTSDEHRPPGLSYYRQARREFARLYRKHGLSPPGIPAGSHVSVCHDIYRHMDDTLSSSSEIPIPHASGIQLGTK
ncbi:MAG: radical SAM protein [Pirellulales bacterium]